MAKKKKRHNNNNRGFLKPLNKILILLIITALVYFVTGTDTGQLFYQYTKDFLSQYIQSDENELSKNKQLLEGTIVHVSDGDTVTLLLKGNKKIKIRLYGIDAPEIGQKYGEEAKVYLQKYLLNKKVSVVDCGIDKYNRVLGIIYIGSLNINEELLTDGLAWQYHFNKDDVYKKLMQNAKKKKINIWSDPRAIDPYHWRKKNKK